MSPVIGPLNTSEYAMIRYLKKTPEHFLGNGLRSASQTASQVRFFIYNFGNFRGGAGGDNVAPGNATPSRTNRSLSGAMCSGGSTGG